MRHAARLRLGDERHARRARQAREVHARAGGRAELEDRAQRDRLRDHRNRREAQARGDLALVGDAARGERAILRAQPHGEAEARRVAHRLQQRRVVGQRRLALEEADAARLGELGHLREPHALQARGERAQRMHARAIHRSRRGA